MENTPEFFLTFTKYCVIAIGCLAAAKVSARLWSDGLARTRPSECSISSRDMCQAAEHDPGPEIE